MITRIRKAFRDLASTFDHVFFILTMLLSTPIVYIASAVSVCIRYLRKDKKAESDSAEVKQKPPTKLFGTFLNRTTEPAIEDREGELLIKGLGFP